MKSRLAVAVMASMTVGLAACGDKEPKGQVVATVDGAEITAIDLKNELGNFSTPDPKIRKAAEMQALDRIVVRKILANAAKEQKIDKTPEYAQQEERLQENLLVQTWQNRLTRAVPPPSKEEIDKFIAENPDLYAQRKVLAVQQIRMPRAVDPGILNAMQPMKTLDEIAALLTERKVPFQRGAAQFDAFTNDPTLVAQVLKVAPTDVFVIPNGNLLLVNQTQAINVQPVTPQQATEHATNYLKMTRTREAVQRDFKRTIEAARKDVKFAKAYDPKLLAPPAKGSAPAKGAPPATGAAPAKGG